MERNEVRSERYLIQFTHYGTAYAVPVSEVPLARGAVAYVIKMRYYKGMFIKSGTQWNIKSKGIISEGLKNRIIKEILLYRHKMHLIEANRLRMQVMI